MNANMGHNIAGAYCKGNSNMPGIKPPAIAINLSFVFMGELTDLALLSSSLRAYGRILAI